MSGEDQYGDYSRRGEYEGKDPPPRRTTRGTDPYAELGSDEANQAGSSYAGRGDGAAYPRSYGRDYSGRGSDYAAGSASQDYQQPAGGYPTQQQGHSAAQPWYAARAGPPPHSSEQSRCQPARPHVGQSVAMTTVSESLAMLGSLGSTTAMSGNAFCRFSAAVFMSSVG